MKWNDDAREIVDAIPIHDIIKNMLIIWAERCARRNGSDVVTIKEINQTRDDYFTHFGEAKMRKIQEARESGKSDADLDFETQLNKDPALYRIELCHSRFFGCPKDVIDVRKVGLMIKQKLEDLRITEILADKAFEVLLPHSVFTVSVSGCANICTASESKDIGIHGVAKPMITDKECIQCSTCFHYPSLDRDSQMEGKQSDRKCIRCRKCVDVCLDRIISFADGKPVINQEYCKLCGACISACPVGAIGVENKGCRILVGGTFGRFAHYGMELFKMTEVEKILPVLEASVGLIKKELSQTHEDNFSLIMRRTGIFPIFEYLAKTGNM